MNAMPGYMAASVLIACLLLLPAMPIHADGKVAESGDAAALRRATLVAELLEEDANAEALAEAVRLRVDFPDIAEDALAPFRKILDLDIGTMRQTSSPRGVTGGGIGGWLARRVVGFYRIFVGPAIGSRCALEPSCSQYFLQTTRKHGLVGIPMTADRFVREPVVSAPGRPVVRNAAGELRHPDPVSDHDWWFE